MRRASLFVLLLCGGCGAAAATTVYRCTDARGASAYQDRPCASGQRQQVVRLDDSTPMPSPAASIADASASMPTPVMTTRPAPPPVSPLPALFTCVRATDGQSYLSDNGDPAPYQAPLAMLDAFQPSLSQTYGPDHGAAGMSAPEANRGRVTTSMVANYYVWVQDRCRALSPTETCAALRDAYDEVERKLQRAFDSQKPPLEARERELIAQLRGC
jgi:hypothetical protein